MAQSKSIFQLPLWPEAIRGLPNAVARSALFSVNYTDPRMNYHRQVVASQEGINIIYTGEELRLDDEDVLLQLIHLARMRPLGEEVMFSTYALIKSLGWTVNKRSYERLYDSIVRMKATNVTIKFTDATGAWREYHESLISSAVHGGNKAGGQTDTMWRIRFHKEVLVLFGEATYTYLDWQTRLKLPPLAKKLHSFYMSHEFPYGMTVEALQTLAGSRTKQRRQFRYKLKEALNLLVDCKFLQSFVVDPTTDLVRVVKIASPLSLEN